MADERQTFGTYISDTRKKMGLSQKQLAELIEREEGGAISPHTSTISSMTGAAHLTTI